MASNEIKNVEHVQDEEFYQELEQETTAIEKLPDECILSIFYYIRPRDRCNLARVSKRFNRLADQWFRASFAKKIVNVHWYPSVKLQLFGTSIVSLRLHFGTNVNNMKEICELCPNLKNLTLLSEISGKTFIQPFFRKQLSQMVELKLFSGIDWEGTPGCRNDFIAALKYCENLTTLELWDRYTPPNIMLVQLAKLIYGTISDYEPFLRATFPKLYHFHMDIPSHKDDTLSCELLNNFLQSNTSVRSLSITDSLNEIDLSCVFTFQCLERLSLITQDIDYIIPKLPQLYRLNYLQLCMCTDVHKDLLDKVLNSLMQLPNLNELSLLYSAPITMSETIKDTCIFRNEDLLRFKCLPKLKVLRMPIGTFARNYVTLRGISEALKQNPNWTAFYINEFRQDVSPDGSTFIDEDIHFKFCQDYFKRYGEGLTIETNKNLKYKAYKLTMNNPIHIFARGLE